MVTTYYVLFIYVYNKCVIYTDFYTTLDKELLYNVNCYKSSSAVNSHHFVGWQNISYIGITVLGITSF